MATASVLKSDLSTGITAASGAASCTGLSSGEIFAHVYASAIFSANQLLDGAHAHIRDLLQPPKSIDDLLRPTKAKVERLRQQRLHLKVCTKYCSEFLRVFSVLYTANRTVGPSANAT